MLRKALLVKSTLPWEPATDRRCSIYWRVSSFERGLSTYRMVILWLSWRSCGRRSLSLNSSSSDKDDLEQLFLGGFQVGENAELFQNAQ